MVYHLIHKIAVVTNHDNTSWKILKILFENLEGYDIKIVGRLVENQEVRILHQYRTKVQLATLATTKFIHVVVLLFGSKKEILKELRSREMFASTHIDIFGDILNNVYHLHLVVELQSLLREIAKTHGIANIKLSAIRRYLS